MPYILEIPLTRQERASGYARGEKPRALNAMVYHWLEAADKRIVNYVHDDKVKLKPFTVSPWVRLGQEEYFFRVTLLEDEYGAFVLEGMERAMQAQERGGFFIEVGDDAFNVSGPPRVSQRGYSELKERVRTETEIGFEFLTPTSFHVKAMDYVLPDARRVFESYLNRWNEFSGWVLEPGDALLEWIENNVAVRNLDIHSASSNYLKHHHTGFVGEVTYQVVKGARGDADKLHWLNVLGDYATFCGTGRKTTQGMGQTRRVKR